MVGIKMLVVGILQVMSEVCVMATAPPDSRLLLLDILSPWLYVIDHRCRGIKTVVSHLQYSLLEAFRRVLLPMRRCSGDHCLGKFIDAVRGQAASPCVNVKEYHLKTRARTLYYFLQ